MPDYSQKNFPHTEPEMALPEGSSKKFYLKVVACIVVIFFGVWIVAKLFSL